jgi:DNA processing protein
MTSVALDRRVLIALCARDIQSQASALSSGECWGLLAALQESGHSLGDISGDVDGVGADSRIEQRLEALDQVDALVDQYAGQNIWVLTAVDQEYPERLRARLGATAPAILYGSGERGLLAENGIAVVGSRNLDDEAVAVAETLGRTIARGGLVLISGGARGVDQLAMRAAADADGAVVGVLAHPIEQEARRPDARRLADETRLCLISPFKPSAAFRPANAMARNKVIYGLSRCTAVVASDDGKGGTWSGATEALRRRFGPVAVWIGAGAGPGNARLVERGALPFSVPGDLLRFAREGFEQAADGGDQLKLRL